MALSDFCNIEDMLLIAICQAERHGMKQACDKMNKELEEINEEDEGLYFEFDDWHDDPDQRPYTGFKMCRKHDTKKDIIYEVHNCGMYISIWRATDIECEPEYKGESLSKVIPTGLDNLSEVCGAFQSQHWIYW